MQRYASPISRCRAAALVAAVATLLHGCAALQPAPALPPARALPVPAGWSLAPSAQVAPLPLADWWQVFHDPLLDQLVTRALSANPGLAAAHAAVEQARALRDLAAAGLMPTAALSASAQRSRSNGGARAGNASAAVAGAFDPDIAGERRAAVRAAQADLAAGEFIFAQTRSALVAEVALAYIDLRQAQARLAIARDSLDSQRKTAQITHWRMLAGLATSLEDEQARASAEQAAARLPPLDSAIAQLRHALAVLCAQAPGAFDALPGAAASLPQAQEPVAGVPADLLRRRPDVLAAQRRVEAALARADAADAARFPAFRLEGSLSAQGWDVAGAPRTVVRSLLASVAAPLFDAGAGLAQVRAQQALVGEARANYESTLLGALQEVEDELAGVAAGRARIARLDAAVEAAANAALLARQRYASGLVDFQVVLETQRNLFTVQDDAAVSRAALAAGHARLFRALGGGWAGPDGNAQGTP